MGYSRIRASFAAIFALALGACGGTQGESPLAADSEVIPEPRAATFIDDWSPYLRIDKLVHIGGGVFETILPVGPHSAYLRIPPATTRHGDTEVWHDHVTNGTPLERALPLPGRRR